MTPIPVFDLARQLAPQRAALESAVLAVYILSEEYWD
jgi:hypothetical protein